MAEPGPRQVEQGGKQGSRRGGLFIALEGVDGAGSSTQTQLLVKWLSSRGLPAVATKEPNPEGMIEKVIRRLLNEKSSVPELDALLFAADRADHVKRLIEPWLAEGRVVVSDRYLESSVAYQTSQGLDEVWVLAINRYAVPPDLTIIMDIDPALSLRRKTGQAERFETVAFLSKVRKRFLERAAAKGYTVVDAGMDVEAVHGEIVRAVEPLLRRLSTRP